MAKKRTKSQKFADYADVINCIREGKKVKRSGTKDGSIATHPVVPVTSCLLEAGVLKDCLKWLKIKGIFCNRHDTGAGDIAGVGYATYGIVGAGDIIGLLPNGKHFEIECKRGKGGRLTIRQQKRMKDIRKNNGLYFIVHGVQELQYYFAELI